MSSYQRRRLGRRKFVQLLGAGTAASAVAFSAPGCGGSGDSDSSESVIVIGAGVAGLTIGNALTTAGIQTIVLEARERLGGRVWTEDVGGVSVDLGGMWISGPDGNPSACILNHEGLAWSAAEPFDLNVRAYDSVLQEYISLADLLQISNLLDAFDAAIPMLLETLGASATFSDAITEFLGRSGLEGTALRRAEFGLRTQVEIPFAQSPNLISLASYDFSNALPGGEYFPDGGYRGLVNALARGVDVRTGSVVSRIAYSELGVSVETSNGVVRGSHAVVTVPLGVLKAGSIEFSPELPAEKSTAIDRLAMAQLEKVVLRYDEAFWRSPGSGNLLYLAAEAGEFPLFVDYTPYAGGEPTLVAFYCGDYGRAIASMSDDAIAARAAAIVDEMAGTSAHSPQTAQVTSWKSDPYALGSYVYLPVGASVADIEALAAPVGERLLFSGEATSTQYSGYVHGAILSGIREAERLLGTEGQGVRLESGLLIKKGCEEDSATEPSAKGIRREPSTRTIPSWIQKTHV